VNNYTNSKVIIIGRPNVGKSTLFNMLLHKKHSITSDMEGVTRDSISSTASINGKSFTLIDTGGFTLEKEYLSQEINKKTFELIEEAHLILFVVSVKEITALDRQFSQLLRKHNNKVSLIVNKVDSQEQEIQAYEYYNLGFQNTLFISATHKRGLIELREYIEENVLIGSLEEQEDPVLRLSVLGKPNVGKSTLVNTLTQKNNSLVENKSGTTRDSRDFFFSFEDKTYTIYDTAGIRKKAKVNEDVEYYSVNRALKTIESVDIVWLIIDSLEGLSEQDKKITAKAVKKGKGIILLLNKWDLQDDTDNKINAFKDRIYFLFPHLNYAPIMPISALNNDGLKPVLRTSHMLFNELNKRIETSKLNYMLKQWIMENPLPAKLSKKYKLKYITQVSAHPVHIILYINNKKGFPAFYLSYIKNKIRSLGFHHIPFELILKD